MAFVFLVLAFVAGGGLPVQAGLNARLAEWVGGPIRASMISFGLGTVVLFLLALVATRGVVNTDKHYRRGAPGRGRRNGALLLAGGDAGDRIVR
jgi:uncharacterized membrane protein YdcZ (DUF606 family)